MNKTVSIEVPAVLAEKVRGLLDQHAAEVAESAKEKRSYCFHEFTYSPVVITKHGNPAVIKTCTKCGRTFRQVIGSPHVWEI